MRRKIERAMFKLKLDAKKVDTARLMWVGNEVNFNAFM